MNYAVPLLLKQMVRIYYLIKYCFFQETMTFSCMEEKKHSNINILRFLIILK